MRLTNWWESPSWLDYEAACGDRRGTRSRTLDAATWSTRVVDLRPDEAELWRGVRKSYHSLINAALRAYRIETLSGVGAAGMTRTAQMLHRIDAGRQTRPGASWDRMSDMLDVGRALVTIAFGCGRLLSSIDPVATIETPDGALDVSAFDGTDTASGFAFFFVCRKWAYYASAATLEGDLNAALVWRSILAAKENGAEILEMGWQGEATDEKGKNIEFFRRGFGGYDIPIAETRS